MAHTYYRSVFPTPYFSRATAKERQQQRCPHFLSFIEGKERGEDPSTKNNVHDIKLHNTMIYFTILQWMMVMMRMTMAQFTSKP